jgi:hypothetical protein
MSLKIVFALLALAFFSGNALSENVADESEAVFPQRLNAQELLYTCNASAITSKGRERRRYCEGFISGVEEASRLIQADRTVGQKICMPSATSSRELRAVYTRYATKNTQLLAEPAAQVALGALQLAYPCLEK